MSKSFFTGGRLRRLAACQRVFLPPAARVLFSALFLYLTPFHAAAAKSDFDKEISRQKRELDELRDQLERGQKELSQLKEKQSTTLEELDRLANNIGLTDRYMKKLEATESLLDRSLHATRYELEQVGKRINQRNQLMATRVRALYISGGPERALVLGSEGGKQAPADFLERIYFMRRILRYDESLVKAGQVDASRKRDVLAKLDTKRQELQHFRERKAKERERFSLARAVQEKALSRLQNDLKAKDQALQELEDNARLLTDIIRGLEKRRQEELARNKKARELETGQRYCLPVAGVVVSRYGMQYHATLKTSTRNLGIEIAGENGVGVRAAVSGEVAMITRIPGYGQGIILDNGSGYFTIYANLSGIKVRTGDKVKTCEEIASVAADPGRVYFEVRHGTKTLDPVQWLKGGEK